MNRNKSFNVHVLKFIYYTEDVTIHIKGDELKRIIKGIRSLPIDVKSDNSRYSNPGSNSEHCLIFLDETTIGNKTDDNLLPALFIHRRGNYKPFEEDGKGHLIELKLSNINNELAEIAYILINIDSGFCFWIYNPFVGGTNQFTEYINKKLVELSKKGFILFDLYGMVPLFTVASIIQDNAFDEFDKIAFVRKLEYHISSTPEKLTQYYLTENDDGKGMDLLRNFIKHSGCARISLTIGADKKKTDKKTKKPIFSSLNKKFVKNLFNQTEAILRENQSNQFNIIGTTIDDDSRVIDLLYQRLFYRITVEFEDNFIPIYSVINQMTDLMRNKYGEIQRFCR
jgi:hypothetical protein